ncbi:MAG TPA: carbohydrate porin [Pyrinomonadaceae bacterium]|nr:carbohydrate porin [Pyrinomonadaceae bacterium]
MSKVSFVSSTLAALLTLSFVVKGQQPSPTPSPKPSPGASLEIKHDSSVDQKSEPTPAPSPELDFWHQETMTGDWGGTRARWRERGFEMQFTLTQFVQGTAAGGLRRDTEGNGKFEAQFNIDLDKVWGWKYWSAETKVEYRFGGPVLTGTGAINTVNTDVTVPASQGSVVAITAFNFTRVFPVNSHDQIEVSFGRFNTLDIQEKFFGGAGLEKFFNVAHIGPMTGLRQVPNVTNGAGIDYVRKGESFISFGILDPNDHSTNVGLDNLFGDGVTLAPVINLPSKWFGKTGKHSFSYTVTTKKYTPFDAIRQIVLPGPPLNPVQPKRGSFSISYVGRQFLVERNKDDGWGVFTQLSIADKDTSPVTRFIDVGLGGNGIFTARPQDDFGIAYAYTGLSEVLKDNLNLVTLGNVRPHAEHQFEGFYNFHITPWLKLTGDLQIIRPVVRRANTAVIPGARLELIF